MTIERIIEVTSSKEIDIDFTPEAYVVFGRGVAKDSHDQWHPTPLTELLSGTGHSGQYDTSPDPTDPKTTIGGANANAYATYHEIVRLYAEGTMPSLVIFAAGRPAYLIEEPDEISEGSILRDKIFGRLEHDGIPVPESVTLTQNKNTKDDVIESLRILEERGISRATIITISTHVQRVEAFVELARLESGLVNTQVKVVASDEILSENPKFKRVFDEVKQSEPYLRSNEYEQKSAESIRKQVKALDPLHRNYHGNIQNAPERAYNDKMAAGIKDRYTKNKAREEKFVYIPTRKP